MTDRPTPGFNTAIPAKIMTPDRPLERWFDKTWQPGEIEPLLTV
jgi:hypothetical protein